MKYKCELHKSNEGYIDDNGKWQCWYCHTDSPIKVDFNDYLLRQGSKFIKHINEYSFGMEEERNDTESERYLNLIGYVDPNSKRYENVFTVILTKTLFYLDEENGDPVDEEEIEWKAWDFYNLNSARNFFRKIKDNEIQV